MSTPTTGANVRKARETAGMTLADTYHELRLRLPRSMTVSQATLQRIETDKTRPDFYLLLILADLFGCTLSDLSPEDVVDLEAARELVMRVSPCIAA